MNFVTIIGVSVLGLITILSAFHGYKAYRGYKLRQFEDYSEEASILKELDNEDLYVEDSSFSKIVSSMKSSKSSEEITNQQLTNVMKSAVDEFSKRDTESKDVKSTQSSLRSAAIEFNKRENDRVKSGSTDIWSSTTSHLFTSSVSMDKSNRCDESSVFDTGNSSFGSSFSSSNDSSFSGDTGGGGCD
ncbi:hypothetical protein [Lysinibacillus sphaericus]|uniref:hypothetical protein n=1 Tax=Lysinibacillus sphaericus TaxID=1421 RepID=UPI000C192219|nr:hypothetical protein [Lysinibacillus sphaericus]PIJ97981.1 hypothetical protein CTN02_09560 [Lysinibacillus sphaericus]